MKFSRTHTPLAPLALLTLFLGSGALHVLPAAAAPRPGSVLAGNVIVKRKNLKTTTTLRANDNLEEGDIVSTSASKASLRFADGSRVEMASESALEITKPTSVGGSKLLMRALNGRMAARLTPGKVIATRTALIRVKGTEIVITITPDGGTILEVLEGAAEFFNPCGQVMVGSGQQSNVKPGSAPSTPSAIPNVNELLKQWELSNVATQTPDAMPGNGAVTVVLTGATEAPSVIVPATAPPANQEIIASRSAGGA